MGAHRASPKFSTCAVVREGDGVGLNEAVENTWEAEQVCGIWRRLPGYAQSEFRFVHATLPEDELAFYPVLRRCHVGLEFRSLYFADFGLIRLQRTDVLAWCPAKCVWVLCYLCQKFLWGLHEHRTGKQHGKKLGWSQSLSADELLCEYVPLVWGSTRPLYHLGQDAMP